ncbi:MAG: fumarate hydratase, partial [Verrucomicrobiia bacterium]
MSSTPSFVYQDPFPLGKDDTEYRLLSTEGVSTTELEGQAVLKVEPDVLTFLANQAFHDCSFTLRAKHLEQVAA